MTAAMRLSPEQHRHLESRARRFVAAVARARRSKTPVSTSLRDFPAGDMFLVYCALVLAASEGVAVVFAPPAARDSAYSSQDGPQEA